jgi:uncharacterized membrane protein YkvA (DUF1232 family)
VSEAIGQLKQRARQLKAETYALYLAYKDPRVPWYAKVVVACVVGYALSPIDLVPDFIPILGYLDDLILVPAGIALALRLIPKEVMAECRDRAREALGKGKPKNWVAAGAIIAVWAVALALAAMATVRFFRR